MLRARMFHVTLPVTLPDSPAGSPPPTRRSSSFRIAMRILPPRQRAAMAAIYAFCRALDDVADGAIHARRRPGTG